jgi:hypothetical protein
LIGLAKDAPDALDHKLSNLIDGIDLTRETHQATAALEKMLDVLAKGGDPAAIRTSQMLVRLARTFAMPTETLRDQLAARIRKAASRRAAPPKIESSENSPRPQVPAKPLEPITGIDRELFEIMIEYPDAAAQAIELVDPQWLISGTARMLMRVYQDLELQGRELDMQTLMLAIEDERLKGVLVSLDESIQQRADFASQPFRERFNGLLMRFNRLQHTATSQKRLTRIESDPVDIDSATELLGDIIAAQRLQQGLKPK